MKVVMKTEVLFLTQLKNDPLMVSFLCSMSPKGDYNIIVDEKICGTTRLSLFSTACMDDNLLQNNNLFEAGQKFTYFQPLDTNEYYISWHDSVTKSDLFTYMNSSNDTSLYVKLKMPYESDERYWHEIVLLNRINRQALYYILVYDKKNLQLMHIFREFVLDTYLQPVKLCDAKEYIIYNEYEFPNKIWEFGRLVDY